MNTAKKLQLVDSATEPMSLDDARAARQAAETALRTASSEVETIARRWPAPMSDRRYLAELVAKLPAAVNDQNLNGKAEQKRLDLRDFDTAVKAESRARAVLELAIRTEAPLQAAADETALGDGRANLQQAIEALDAAKANAAAQNAATSQAEDAVYAENDRIIELEEELKAAPAAMAEHMRETFLGTAGAAPRTAAEIRADIGAATEKRDALRLVRDALKAEAGHFTSRLSMKEGAVRTATAHVVRVHPATRKLAAEYLAAVQVVDALRPVIDFLDGGRMIPDGALMHRHVDDSAAAPWRNAVARLATDATTTLPEVQS